MKHLLIIIGIAALCGGCAKLDETLMDRKVTTQPALVDTNTGDVVAVRERVTDDNPGGTIVIIDPAITSTNQLSDPKYEWRTVQTTEWIEKPVIKDGLSFIGSLPVPYAGLAATLAGMGLAIYRSLRNRKTATALIAGIDGVRRVLNETPEGKALDAKIKQKLQEHQVAAGVITEVESLLKKYTMRMG